MAVQYIPNTPLPLPVRRSTRHIALPPTPSSSTALTSPASSSGASAKSSRVVARSPPRRRPRQSLAITPSTPATPTPTGSRSRKRPRFQDEPDQKEQDRAVESFPSTPSPRTRPTTIIAPITPEPTPRAIRAQKRRKLTDSTEAEPASDLSSSSSSSSPSLSPSHSVSPTTPLPQPISPEPISPSHSHSDSASRYIVKSRPRKRKLDDNGASSIASPSSDTPTPPSGDPLPRSLTKRRKLDRTSTSRQKPLRAVKVRSKSKSSISSGTPTTTLTSKKRTNPKLRPSRTRTSLSLPRGGTNGNDHRTKDVRRSARLLVHTTDESQHKYPSDAQLEESLPLSPLTPPSSEDDPSESSQLTDSAIEQHADFTSSSAKTLAEEEDDTEMEMIACIPTAFPSDPPTSPPTSWRSIIPSHISNPVLKGRPPPNPALYTQLQLASYRRTKPNTPSPLSLYSYTGVTPPTSPALSAAAINSLDAIDDIPSLGEAAAVEAIGVIAEGGSALSDQLFHEQQQSQMQFYGQGYSQESQQQQHQSLSGQSFEPHLQQSPANAALDSSVASPESSDPPPLDVNFMMIDLQLQMQLQHMGIPGSASEGMHFGVDQIGFMMGHAAEERNDRTPATVHMQDVHLHQQPHQNQNHQQQIMGVQPNQLFGYPYFSTEQQGQIQQGSNHMYGTQEYDGGSQSFQDPEYQQQRQFQDQQQAEYPHHQEQPQAASSSSYEAYGRITPYQSGPQVYDHQQRPHQQQDFQTQEQQQHGGDGTPPFSSSTLNVGYDASAYQKQTQTSPSSPVAPPTTSAAVVAAPSPIHAAAATPIPHYTLSMHDALLFFQQSHSRFHEDQHLLAADSVEMHSRQLEEFQREKEERKRRLKRTKLVREVQVVPMGSSAAALGSVPGIGVGACSGVGRARGLWAVACKARMFEVVRIYTPALIREVTEISAREYYRRMGLKYPACRFALSRYRRRTRKREDEISVSEDDPLVDRDGGHEQEGGDAESDSDEIFDVLSSLEKKDDGDADGEEFRKEKIFDFELLDDDEDDDEEMMDEMRKQVEVNVDLDEETDDDQDEDDEDDGDEEVPESGVDLDLEAIRDPFFQPELSMRITPQAPMPSISGGVETAFYAPPPEVHAVLEQSDPLCEEQVQDPDLEAQLAATSSPNGNPTTTGTSKQSQKQKFLLFHRPVLPLPPPALSTFRPTALRFYNVDPVHAGRGTPCVKERREMWGGVPKVSSLSFSVKQVRGIEGCDDELSSSGNASSDVTAWYVADEVQVATAKDVPSSMSCATGPGSTEKDDSVFGDCVGVCCMDEDTKGKKKAVEVEVEEQEVERRSVGGGRREEELPRGEEEAHQNDGAPSSTSAALPQQSIAQPPPQPARHMTVEIPPAHPDRIPHRRRGVLGRTELLKVYAPPPRLVPSILPLARRPPRPPPMALELGPDETETTRSLATPQVYHYPVVPYSWEQVSEAMEVLAYQGIDASVWMDGHSHPPSPSPLSPNGISGTEVQIQPTFNPSSSELSSALG